jgi:hypothetical protein
MVEKEGVIGEEAGITLLVFIRTLSPRLVKYPKAVLPKRWVS